MIELSDGKQVEINKYAITREEFKRLYSFEMEDEEAFKVVSRMTGLEESYLDKEISWIDWRVLLTGIREAITGPLEDEKNSAGGSTSD